MTNLLEKYRVLGELGKGAYGKVYKVETPDRKIYAMKVMDLEGQTPVAITGLVKEGALLQKLKHPNIIHCEEYFQIKNKLYLIMEYAGGGDLAKLIRRYKKDNRKIPEKEVWRFAKELTSALIYMHNLGYMHRDIKTANIFLSETNEVKLGDFGVTTLLRGKSLKGNISGTPTYYAPELVKKTEYNHKVIYSINEVDVWASGCVIYNLTNLEHPFKGEKFADLAINILETVPNPVDYSYSENLRSVIDIMLQKQQKFRPYIFALEAIIIEGKSANEWLEEEKKKLLRIIRQRKVEKHRIVDRLKKLGRTGDSESNTVVAKVYGFFCERPKHNKRNTSTMRTSIKKTNTSVEEKRELSIQASAPSSRKSYVFELKRPYSPLKPLFIIEAKQMRTKRNFFTRPMISSLLNKSCEKKTVVPGEKYMVNTSRKDRSISVCVTRPKTAIHLGTRRSNILSRSVNFKPERSKLFKKYSIHDLV